MQYQLLTKRIIGLAMRVHRTLGPGFLESVYQNALRHELLEDGLTVECGRRLQVQYRGVVVGDFVADMMIENLILVENKAVQSLNSAHEAQVVNYLVATQVDVGLLLNFGSTKLQIKRKSRVFRSSDPATKKLTGGQDGQDGYGE